MPTHTQVQGSPRIRQCVRPRQGESPPVTQGWILLRRGSRKGSETPRVAVAIAGTGRVLAGTELAPRALCGAQQLPGTTACAHLCILGTRYLLSCVHSWVPSAPTSHRKKLTLAPSAWTFPLDRSPPCGQRGLSITGWTTWESFPISPALTARSSMALYFMKV